MTNFPFSRKILMSKKDKRPSFSFSNEKLMLGCLEEKYFLDFSAWLREENWASFLTLLTQNEYIITDSFHFTEEIYKQDPNLYMASVDVDFLLLTFWMKPLIFALIVSIKMMRITLRSLRVFFVICLLWPPKKYFLCF